MADTLDVLLSILMDKQAQRDTIGALDQLENKIAGLDDAELNDLAREFDDLATKIEINQVRFDQLEKQIQSFNKVASSAAQGARISQAVLGVGVATVGGIFAAANKYVQDAERATAVTRAWKAEMDLISRNGERIGAVLAQEALPLLTQAARVTGQIARFIEQNPGLIKAAIGFGSAAAVIGGIGTAVFRGIETFARIGSLLSTAQLTAARMMQAAADKQLLAAAGMNKGAVGAGASGLLGKAGGATIAGVSVSTLGTITAAAAAFLALSIGISKEFDVLYAQAQKLGNAGKLVTATLKLVEESFKFIPGMALVPAIRNLRNEFEELRPVLERLGLVAKEAKGAVASKGVAGTTSFGGGISKDVLDAYIQFRDQALEIERDFQQDRLDIIRDYNASVISAVQDNQKAVSKINSNYQSTIADIYKSFNKENTKAERDYQQQRADIIRDSGEEIQRIEENLQEQLRKLSLDHEDKVDDLVASRDALGLVREQRRYQRERDEAERQANLEIARRRQDVAQRLQEARREFLEERAQRQEQLAERLQDAYEAYQEELKAQQEANAERMKDLRDAEQERLRELDYQHNAELARNREHFIARIRDLDAALLGEQQLRRAYYAQMIRDAQAFFDAYRRALPGGTGTTTGTTGTRTGVTTTTTRTGTTLVSRQHGGYTGDGGLINTHQGEYVMNRETTRMMEGLIGGRLTEGALRNFAQGGSTSNVNLSFPGGLVTVPMLGDILDDRDSKLVRTLARSLK